MIIFAIHSFIIYIVCRPVVEIANNSPITIFYLLPTRSRVRKLQLSSSVKVFTLVLFIGLACNIRLYTFLTYHIMINGTLDT